MKSAATSRRKRGRPLSFDREAALHEAMLLFWRYGYEATSLSQLTAAMGISPPSLYASFGDKKQLFLEAVERYTTGPVTDREIIDSAPTAREAVWGLLEHSARAFTDPDTPAGCLLSSAAMNCSAAASGVQAALAELRRAFEDRLRAKIEHDIRIGLLPRGTDADALSLLYATLILGMSSQARDGIGHARLLAMAGAAMNAWPAGE